MHIGIDIEEIGRFENLLTSKPNLLKKIFFDNEILYSQKKRNPAQTLCGIWCAKEAVVKALWDFESLNVNEINILHYKNGVPYVNPIKNFNLSLSISHTDKYATAVALALKIQ